MQTINANINVKIIIKVKVLIVSSSSEISEILITVSQLIFEFAQ